MEQEALGHTDLTGILMKVCNHKKALLKTAATAGPVEATANR